MSKLSPKEYDAWYETPFGSLCDRLEKEAIFALFKPKGFILDVGCGTGIYTLELARQGIKVISIDSSFDMAAFAKRNTEGRGLNANFVIGRAEAMPFRSNIFDGVLEVTSLCFISDTQGAVFEMNRVLKVGGDIILGELNRWSYWAFLRRIKGLLFKKSVYRGAKFLSLKGLKRLLQDAGFKDFEWSTCIYFPPINSQGLLNGYRFFETIGMALFSKSGAFVVVKGVK